MADSGFPHRLVLSGVALSLLCLGRAAAGFAAEPSQERAQVSVFAAASLADALAEIGAAWAATSGNHPVFNFGASSDLARQIRAGAPADIFFSADTAQMDSLERQGLVRAGDRHDLLSNTLVVIVPEASTARVANARELAVFRSIAIADPQAVPAGVYARSWLQSLGLWDTLAARVVPTLHVRAALAAVESGNAEAGIVYRTDAAHSKRARIAFEVAPSEGPPIRYAVAALATAPRAAAAFVAHLRSPAARAVFVRHGFQVQGGR